MGTGRKEPLVKTMHEVQSWQAHGPEKLSQADPKVGSRIRSKNRSPHKGPCLYSGMLGTMRGYGGYGDTLRAVVRRGGYSSAMPFILHPPLAGGIRVGSIQVRIMAA